MTTLADSLASTINTNWNVGSGGTEPTIYNTEDNKSGIQGYNHDWIEVQNFSLDTRHKRINDSYADRFHTITVICHTIDATDKEARLDEISNEVARIVGANGLTGIDEQYVSMRSRASPDNAVEHSYTERMQITLIERMADSATAYGASSLSTFEVDELTVNTHITGLGLTITAFVDEDNMASDSAVSLASQQSIKAYVDKHNMIGTANAAYISCIPVYGGTREFNLAEGISNTAAADKYWYWRLGEPTNKGGLKLYIKGCRPGVMDCEATAYVKEVFVQGLDYTGQTSINTNTTDCAITTPGEPTVAFGSPVDASGYEAVGVRMLAEVSGSGGAGTLDVIYINLLCYYDT